MGSRQSMEATVPRTMLTGRRRRLGVSSLVPSLCSLPRAPAPVGWISFAICGINLACPVAAAVTAASQARGQSFFLLRSRVNPPSRCKCRPAAARTRGRSRIVVGAPSAVHRAEPHRRTRPELSPPFTVVLALLPRAMAPAAATVFPGCSAAAASGCSRPAGRPPAGGRLRQQIVDAEVTNGCGEIK